MIHQVTFIPISELESRQGPTRNHPPARHHLPDHHRWPLWQELPLLPDVRPLKGRAALHPGPHRHPTLLLPKYWGQGHSSASLEAMEKHQVSSLEPWPTNMTWSPETKGFFSCRKNCQAQVQSQVQVPNPKSKVQRKGTGTGADTIILQATHTPTHPPPHITFLTWNVNLVMGKELPWPWLTFLDLPWPSMAFHDLPWSFITF